MPLNEASGPRRSNLTKQQRWEAEAAIFGLSPQQEPIPYMDFSNITPEIIEKLREIVLSHDRQNKVNEFDLNKPPKEAYQHQEFPYVLYHHGSKKTRLVHNPRELETAVEQGWSREPSAPEIEEVELDAADSAEAAAIDKQLVKRASKK